MGRFDRLKERAKELQGSVRGVATPFSPISRSRFRVTGDGEVCCRKTQRNGALRLERELLATGSWQSLRDQNPVQPWQLGQIWMP